MSHAYNHTYTSIHTSICINVCLYLSRPLYCIPIIITCNLISLSLIYIHTYVHIYTYIGNDYLPKIRGITIEKTLLAYGTVMKLLPPDRRYLLDLERNTFNYIALYLLMNELRCASVQLHVHIPRPIHCLHDLIQKGIIQSDMIWNDTYYEHTANQTTTWSTSLTINNHTYTTNTNTYTSKTAARNSLSIHILQLLHPISLQETKIRRKIAQNILSTYQKNVIKEEKAQFRSLIETLVLPSEEIEKEYENLWVNVATYDDTEDEVVEGEEGDVFTDGDSSATSGNNQSSMTGVPSGSSTPTVAASAAYHRTLVPDPLMLSIDEGDIASDPLRVYDEVDDGDLAGVSIPTDTDSTNGDSDDEDGSGGSTLGEEVDEVESSEEDRYSESLLIKDMEDDDNGACIPLYLYILCYTYTSYNSIWYTLCTFYTIHVSYDIGSVTEEGYARYVSDSDVEEYLKGLLWVAQMYTGACVKGLCIHAYKAALCICIISTS